MLNENLDLKDVLQHLKRSDEYIIACIVRELSEEKKSVLVLCRECWYRMNIPKTARGSSLAVSDAAGRDMSQPMVTPELEWREDYSWIQSVVRDEEGNTNNLQVNYYQQHKKNFVLQFQDYNFENREKRDEFFIVFNRLLQDYWQRIFEARLIPEPEIYQFHLFLQKISRRGKPQLRCLVLSSDKVYSLKMSPGETDPKKSTIRWVVPWEILSNLEWYKLSPDSFSIVFDKKNAPKSVKNLHSLCSFSCNSEKERKIVVAEIRRLVYSKTNSPLQCEITNSQVPSSKD
eukprot:gb/GECH01002433.1/.p1 GENE.gb/GECH01002433.1/~~gb/GECH01002433.1/.p1  ORF type:complete len:288 (+),score=56.41 gb/GECH01002433.1/:1-864(+)